MSHAALREIIPTLRRTATDSPFVQTMPKSAYT